MLARVQVSPPRRTRGPAACLGPPRPTLRPLSRLPRLLAPPPHEGFFGQEPPDEFDRNLQNMKTLIDFYLQGEVRARQRGARGRGVRATRGTGTWVPPRSPSSVPCPAPRATCPEVGWAGPCFPCEQPCCGAWDSGRWVAVLLCPHVSAHGGVGRGPFLPVSSRVLLAVRRHRMTSLPCVIIT